jgi:hypothetical protein
VRAGGPIGTVFALMSYLIAIGVVVILGAVTGLVWQERGMSFRAAFRKTTAGSMTDVMGRVRAAGLTTARRPACTFNIRMDDPAARLGG